MGFQLIINISKRFKILILSCMHRVYLCYRYIDIQNIKSLIDSLNLSLLSLLVMILILYLRNCLENIVLVFFVFNVQNITLIFLQILH